MMSHLAFPLMPMTMMKTLPVLLILKALLIGTTLMIDKKKQCAVCSTPIVSETTSPLTSHSHNVDQSSDPPVSIPSKEKTDKSIEEASEETKENGPNEETKSAPKDSEADMHVSACVSSTHHSNLIVGRENSVNFQDTSLVQK